MENTKEEWKNFFTGKGVTNFQEKRIIVYLIIFAILLIFYSLFFIHDIVDRGVIKDTKSSTIVDPGNNNPVVDNNDRFRILEGTKEWSQLKELSIFTETITNNHVVEGKIAPGVSGIYNFTVENYGSTKKKYDINFIEENPYSVNMMYKLKLNGKYVAGNEVTWVTYEQMSRYNRIISAKANDLYTIEWKWIDADNDTEIGETDGAYYKLYVKTYAEEVQE